MNIRLIKKSIIMVPCLILVTAVIAFGRDHRDGNDLILNKNKHLVAAWMGGGCGNTIAGPGFAILNAEAQTILCADSLPAVCVTLANISDGSIQLMDLERPSDIVRMVGPGQTKAFCLPASKEPTFLALQAMDGSGGLLDILWSVYPTIPN